MAYAGRLVSSKGAGASLISLRLTPQILLFDEYGITYFSNRADGIAVAEAIAASKVLTNLQELDLSHRDLGDDGLKVLVGAAQALPALRRLDLDGCGLTLPAVRALAESALGAQLLYVNLRENANLVRHRTKLRKMFPGAHVEEPSNYAD